MRKTIIGVDIDGIQANTMPALNNFYNRTHGTNFRMEDYRFHDLEKTWGGTKDDAVKVVEAFYQSPEFLGIKPIPGAVEGIRALARRHELFSITSRPESVREVTERFIKGNFGKRTGEVIYTGQYIFAAADIDKGSICLARGASLLIEDSLETALNTANMGLDVFLFNNPGNQPNGIAIPIPFGFHRVFNWPEIVRRLT